MPSRDSVSHILSLTALLLPLFAAPLLVNCGGSGIKGSMPTATSEPPTVVVGGNVFAYGKPDGTIWIANADGSSQQQLVGESLSINGNISAGAAAASAAWSPDGRYLAYSTPRGTLELLEIDSGNTRTLDDGTGGLVTGFEWSSSDTISYSKTTSDPSVPSGQAPWTVTISGEKSLTPGLRHIDNSGAYCWLSAPANQALLCWSKSEYHQGPGGQLYLKWPDGEMQLIAENGEFHSWSPDGHWLAYYNNARGGSRMTGEIHIREIETGRDIELGTFDSDDGARWAPSRDRLIFDNLEIDMTSGAVKELFERPFTGASWSPDLSKVAFIDSGGTLVGLDLATGKRTDLLVLKGFDAHRRLSGLAGITIVGRAWSPDSRYFAFSCPDASGGESVLCLLDTVTDTTREILRLPAASETSVSYSPDWSHILISQRNDSGELTISVAKADGSSLAPIGEGMPLRGPWRPIVGTEK